LRSQGGFGGDQEFLRALEIIDIARMVEGAKNLFAEGPGSADPPCTRLTYQNNDYVRTNSRYHSVRLVQPGENGKTATGAQGFGSARPGISPAPAALCRKIPDAAAGPAWRGPDVKTAGASVSDFVILRQHMA
jgi:hypothetical protein